MKKYAVIVAGGAGLRMGTPLPKQFLPLNGRPILGYTLDIFLRAYEDMEIILVAPPEHPEAARTVVASSGATRCGVPTIPPLEYGASLGACASS